MITGDVVLAKTDAEVSRIFCLVHNCYPSTIHGPVNSADLGAYSNIISPDRIEY